jgi:hypothetical protein
MGLTSLLRRANFWIDQNFSGTFVCVSTNTIYANAISAFLAVLFRSIGLRFFVSECRSSTPVQRDCAFRVSGFSRNFLTRPASRYLLLWPHKYAKNSGFLSFGACWREDPGDLYQATGIQLCGTLLDLCASPVAQTARHRGHVLAPRGGTSEPAITQAKFALDTQYMP